MNRRPREALAEFDALFAWVDAFEMSWPGVRAQIAPTLCVAESILSTLAAPELDYPKLLALVGVWQRCEPLVRERVEARLRRAVQDVLEAEEEPPKVFWTRGPRVLFWLRLSEERPVFCASA